LSQKLISVVKAVDAVKRKPTEYKRQSFFGKLDLWAYVAVYDEKLCEKCWAFAKQQVFRGSELRGKFPYLEIHDNDLIYVNVHPHCRCYLLRIISFGLYEKMMEKLENRGDNLA
jgi:hypothetical protein